MSDVDQLSWLLIEHITSVASLSGEPPVAELVAAVHRNATASGLLVQAIGTKCARTLIKVASSFSTNNYFFQNDRLVNK